MTSSEFETAVQKLTAVIGELQTAYRHVEAERERWLEEREKLQDDLESHRAHLRQANRIIEGLRHEQAKETAAVVAVEVMKILRPAFTSCGIWTPTPVPRFHGGVDRARDEHSGPGTTRPDAEDRVSPGRGGDPVGEPAVADF